MAVNFKNHRLLTLQFLTQSTGQYSTENKNVMGLTLAGKNFVNWKCGIWEKFVGDKVREPSNECQCF
jgi:hypothetical protein